MSDQGKSRGRQSKDSEVKLKIIEWVGRLSTHFAQPQDEEQIQIFLGALSKNTVYQVDEAFNRCLNECMFMPRLADVHRYMPEQKYQAENPGKFRLCGKPILDEIRPIAEEICFKLTGREYVDLDAGSPGDMTEKDAQLIIKVFSEANRIRYQRMGVA